MDANFAEWLGYHVSTSYAKTVVSIMKRFLSAGTLRADHFKTQDVLVNRVYEIFESNPETYLLLPQRDWGQVETEDVLSNDLDSNNAKSTSTMYKTLVCIEWYGRFLGQRSVSLASLSKKLAWRTRNQTESSVLLHLYVPVLTVSKYNMLLAFLRRRQREYLDFFVADFLLLRNRTREELRIFGETELKPFLELCLRYMVFPLDTKTLATMMLLPCVWQKDTVYVRWFTAKHPCFLCYTPDGGMAISYQLHNTVAREHRRVLFTVPTALVGYLHFYVSACRSNYDLSIASTVFVAAHPRTGVCRGAPWQTLVKDVRAYLVRWGLDPTEYQVGPNYVYFSKVLWSVRQTYEHMGSDLLDYTTLSSNLLKCGVSVATMQSTKFYHALQSIRDLREALDFQGLPLPVCHFRLLPRRGLRRDVAAVFEEEIRDFVRHDSDLEPPL
jgi:hypothetical protein